MTFILIVYSREQLSQSWFFYFKSRSIVWFSRGIVYIYQRRKEVVDDYLDADLSVVNLILK